MARKKHIEVFKDKRGKYRFRFVAANGEITIQSQAYTRRHDAKRGARRESPDLPIVVAS